MTKSNEELFYKKNQTAFDKIAAEILDHKEQIQLDPLFQKQIGFKEQLINVMTNTLKKNKGSVIDIFNEKGEIEVCTMRTGLCVKDMASLSSEEKEHLMESIEYELNIRKMIKSIAETLNGW